MVEDSTEEILRQNIDMICDDEDSMLLVGQQVTNQVQARSDLIVVDQDGNLVLVELKRAKKDIEQRKEALEFQAIRYAASCATIQTTSNLIQNVFAPHVEKHWKEFGYSECPLFFMTAPRPSPSSSQRRIDSRRFPASKPAAAV